MLRFPVQTGDIFLELHLSPKKEITTFTEDTYYSVFLSIQMLHYKIAITLYLSELTTLISHQL